MEKDDILIKLIEKIDTNVERLHEKMDSIDKQVTINTQDLTEHKLGVQGCYKRIEIIETRLDNPWYTKVFTKANLAWFIGILSGLSGIILILEKLNLIKF